MQSPCQKLRRCTFDTFEERCSKVQIQNDSNSDCFFFFCFSSGYLDVQLTQADTVKDLIEQLQQWPGSSIVCDSDRWPPDLLDLFFTNASSIVINAPKCGFAWVCSGLPLLFYGCALLVVGLSHLLLPLQLPQLQSVGCGFVGQVSAG